MSATHHASEEFVKFPDELQSLRRLLRREHFPFGLLRAHAGFTAERITVRPSKRSREFIVRTIQSLPWSMVL